MDDKTVITSRLICNSNLTAYIISPRKNTRYTKLLIKFSLFTSLFGRSSALSRNLETA